MTSYVLDNFALTAYVQKEAGAARVSELFTKAESGESHLVMTTVNLGETLYTAYRRGGPDAFVNILNLLADLPVELVDIDLPLSVTAARIKAVLPISYGDCFAAALALDRQASVVTGDREFARVSHLIPVEWLPGARR